MIEIRVFDEFMLDGLAILISQKHEGERRQLLQLGDNGRHDWEPYDPAAVVEPTLRLDGEIARALLDALLRHYEGASDMHTVRSDLLHERGRVDRLIGAVIDVATASREG